MNRATRLAALRRWLPSPIRRYVDASDVEEVTLLGVALLVVLSGLAFMAIAGAVTDGDTQALDEAILRWFRSPEDLGRARGPAWLTEAVSDVTALGSTSVLLLVIGAVSGFLSIQRQRRLLWLFLASSAGGFALNALMKTVFERPRPSIVPHLREVFTLSFPSGHAALSAIVYLTIGVLLFEVVHGRRARLYCLAVAMLATALIGLSRVFLGVHYPSDVLAGWATGIAWASLCWLSAKYLDRRRRRRQP